MRHRRWVLILAVVVLAAPPLFVLGLQVLSAHPTVRETILLRIAPGLGGRYSVGDLEIGFASVELSDIEIELDGGGSVFIPSASANISYRKLLANRFALPDALSAVSVTSPRVTIVVGAVAGEATVSEQSDSESRLAGDLAEAFPDYVGISDAEITFVDSPAGRTVSITSLDLVLERENESRVGGDAVGDCLGGTDNVRASVVWDDLKETLTLSGQAADLSLGGDIAFLTGRAVEVRDGRVEFSGSAVVAGGDSTDYTIVFEIEDGVVTLASPAETLTAVACRGSYDGDALTIEQSRCEWAGAEVGVTGKFAPGSGDLAFDVQGQDVSLARAWEFVGGETLLIDGVADLDADVRGSVGDLVTEFRLAGGAAQFEALSLDRFEAGGTARRGGFEIDALEASLLGGLATVSGAFELAGEGEWTADLSGEVRQIDAAGLARLFGGSPVSGVVSLGDLRISMGNEALDLESTILWDDMTFGDVLLGSGAGGVFLRDEVLSLSLRSPDRGYSVTCELEGVPGFQDGRGEIILDALRADSLLAGLRGQAAGAVAVAGTLDFAVSSGNATFGGLLQADGPWLSAAFVTDGRAWVGGQDWNLRASISSERALLHGVSTPMEGRLAVSSDTVALREVRIGLHTRASVEIGLAGERSLRGSLVASELPLDDAYRWVTGGSSPDWISGLVFSSASLGGTVDRPSATVHFQVGNGAAAGVERLSAAALVSLNDGRVTLEECTVSEGDRPIVTVEGGGELDGELTLAVAGSGIPGPLLGGDRDTRFDLAMGVGGSFRHPTFDARIEGSDGAFLGIPFDDFVARVVGARGSVRADPLVLERRGTYRVSLTAAAPYAALREDAVGHEAALTAEIDGDPIALLAAASPLLEEARGRGRASIHVVGNRSEIAVARAEIEATASRIVPAGLFDAIEDVRLSASVVDGALLSGFVEGNVDGRSIRLESVRDRAVDDRPLEPLIVAGVDLGVLTLLTDAEGVRTSVPGLMYAGDVGRVAVGGRTGDAPFFIAGPAERPLLLGKLEFSDVEFTYPFDSGEEGFGGDFVSRAEWALAMRAGRNLWYRRADASLRVVEGGELEFRGVPAEHTLCVSGYIEAARGSITYMNSDFSVERVTADFPPFCESPRFYIEASTRVRDGTEVVLTMDSVEEAFAFGAPGATLDESAIQLASDDPDDVTREKILAKLRYGVGEETLAGEEQAALERRTAIDVVASQLGGLVVRPLLAPVETRLKRSLRLDLVRIDIDFVEHFLAELDQWSAQEGSGEFSPFLTNSRITLGKYLARNWILSYVGHSETYEEDIGYEHLGLRHEFGIEYEVSRNTSLTLRTVYDPALAGWDRRISIENRYEF